jgi:hypothetical protein
MEIDNGGGKIRMLGRVQAGFGISGGENFGAGTAQGIDDIQGDQRLVLDTR